MGIGLLVELAGCDYSSNRMPPVSGQTFDSGAAASGAPGEGGAGPGGLADTSMKSAILESVINLIQTAPLQPGGDNFKQAVAKLNNYFEGEPEASYQLSSEAREYLAKEIPADLMKGLERTSFELPDARHLEDCMMYHNIAIRVAGTGDDLTRVRRVFDWMVRQVQLVPVNSLAAPNIGQAQVRPYDMLLRGMATEAGGGWSERGWLFMSFCRQLGIDSGLITYTPKGAKEPESWICAVLIDGKLYLFDPRLGTPIPGPGGQGIATLDDALTNPAVLGRLDVPGEFTYAPGYAALHGAEKLGIMLDSSPGYLSPRMLMLQKSLSGKHRTVLFRDPIDQRAQFTKALGKHAADITLWPLPMMVETLLFTNPNFVQATQHALFLFKPEFPLLYARIKQLRGDLPQAITDYMTFRLADNATLMDKKTPMPPDIQQALDMYATYFLALAKLEQEEAHNAERFFNLTLKLLPAPGPRQPYYYMFRWGAQTNLGLLNEARGANVTAISYYTEPDPTAQHHGNLLRARALVWNDPTGPLPPLLPPPPEPPAPPTAAAPAQNPLAQPGPGPVDAPPPPK